MARVKPSLEYQLSKEKITWVLSFLAVATTIASKIVLRLLFFGSNTFRDAARMSVSVFSMVRPPLVILSTTLAARDG